MEILNFPSQLAQTILGLNLLLWVITEDRILFKKEKRPSKKDRKAIILFSLLTLVFVGLSINLFTKEIGHIEKHTYFYFWTGIIIINIGIVFRQYSEHIMGKFYAATLQIQEKQTLIKNGPFGIIRHPCYSGFMLALWGLGFAFLNWIFLIMMVVFSLVVFLIQIRIEERELVKFFGEEYIEYKKETKKLIPFIL